MVNVPARRLARLTERIASVRTRIRPAGWEENLDDTRAKQVMNALNSLLDRNNDLPAFIYSENPPHRATNRSVTGADASFLGNALPSK